MIDSYEVPPITVLKPFFSSQHLFIGLFQTCWHVASCSMPVATYSQAQSSAPLHFSIVVHRHTHKHTHLSIWCRVCVQSVQKASPAFNEERSLGNSSPVGNFKTKMANLQFRSPRIPYGTCLEGIQPFQLNRLMGGSESYNKAKLNGCLLWWRPFKTIFLSLLFRTCIQACTLN